MRFLYVVSFAFFAYCLYDGFQFYLTDLQQRPHMAQYRTLRPAGFRGQGYGILGTILMLLMLSYTIRKRTPLLGKLGNLNRWLDFHIYCGIMGPLFIILHTTFKVNGIISISFWSMIAVASSGIVGRYLYLQIPRNRAGEELSHKQIGDVERRFTIALGKRLDLSEAEVREMELPGLSQNYEKRGPLRLLLSMMTQDLLGFFTRRKLRRHLAAVLPARGDDLTAAVEIAFQKIKLQRRTLFLNHIQRLFHYWHVFHKPFAIIMYIIMALHIGVAIWLGYTWIF